MSSLRQPFVSGVVAHQCVCAGWWWTFQALSLTFVIVLLVTFVADVDDMNSYALFAGIFLHIVHYSIVM